MTTYTHNETDEQRFERLKGWVYKAQNLQGCYAGEISASFPKEFVAKTVARWIKWGFDVFLVDTNEANDGTEAELQRAYSKLAALQNIVNWKDCPNCDGVIRQGWICLNCDYDAGIDRELGIKEQAG